MSGQYYQGDVMFTPVKGRVRALRRLHPDSAGRYVMARGEANGHVHIIYDEPGVELFETATGQRVVVSDHPFIVWHVDEASGQPTGEHDPMTLPAQAFEVGIQTDWMPQTRLERRWD